MQTLTKLERYTLALTIGLTWGSLASSVHAQAMPWESPVRQLLASLQGPTAQTIIISAVVIAGLALCIGEAGNSLDVPWQPHLVVR